MGYREHSTLDAGQPAIGRCHIAALTAHVQTPSVFADDVSHAGFDFDQPVDLLHEVPSGVDEACVRIRRSHPALRVHVPRIGHVPHPAVHVIAPKSRGRTPVDAGRDSLGVTPGVGCSIALPAGSESSALATCRRGATLSRLSGEAARSSFPHPRPWRNWQTR